jgi:hypothetical protein
MRLRISRNGHAGTYKIPADGLKLGDDWLPLNPEQEATYRINRKKNKEVMGQYEDFLAWAKGYLSLKDNVIGAEEHEKFVKSVGGDRSDLMVGSVILGNGWGGYDKDKHAKRLKLRTYLLDLMRSEINTLQAEQSHQEEMNLLRWIRRREPNPGDVQ